MRHPGGFGAAVGAYLPARVAGIRLTVTRPAW
jgi:hypothetical protein